jgi:hypothetical protein
MNPAAKILTPEKFWGIYAETLNEKAKRYSNIYEIYRQHPTKWTETIKEVAEDAIGEFLNSMKYAPPYKVIVDNEYFRIDVCGYIKNYDKQYDWELKVAYEHENKTDWDGELCKLCHIVADLKVIHSYYNPKETLGICELLEKMVNGLGIQRIYGAPNSRWLFIFGAMDKPDIPHKAFTLDPKLKALDITGNHIILPENWAHD